ncbi:hypothetical protein [Streptomyces avicenniae]|uniref:hypothetical protein n=1 Tax=Streptomyces avicenniae TaxID=500153 RepID=UPI00069BC766|nr:hypothetical protein [Streptomyces avicenniae]
MRTYAGVLVGKLVFFTICCFPVPLAFPVAYTAWQEGEDWAWIALAAGLVGSALVVALAVRATRSSLPLLTRRDRPKDTGIAYGDNTFVLWAPQSPKGPQGARLVRADVLEASLARYAPEGEATFTTYHGNLTPDEFTPLVRLRLRVQPDEEGDAGGPAPGAFEVTDEWRVPSVCLSAVTAGRLAVLVGPAEPGTPGAVTPLWPRSALLAGTRTCRVIGLDGHVTEVTGHPVRQLRQMRISWEGGGIAMDGDVIDLRRLDAATAARYAAVAEHDRAHPEDRAPVTEPGEGARWTVDDLPGEQGAFGAVGRRWARRGGVLVRARFVHMASTHTFQDHGPVLDTVLRIRPADGTPPFDAARRLTVPMNYLALLHRTREVVLTVSPDGRAHLVDWARTNLLAGTTAASVVTPDGRQLPVTGRPDVIWALMNLLASHGLSHPTPVLDLRRPDTHAVADAVLDLVPGGRAQADTARL